MMQRTRANLMVLSVLGVAVIFTDVEARADYFSTCNDFGPCGDFADTNSSGGTGLQGSTNLGIGVVGVSGSITPTRLDIGVWGGTNASGGYGVYGDAPGTGGAAAVYGNATASGGTGVLGTGFGIGVSGHGDTAVSASGTTFGVNATATGASSIGVNATGNTGVYGTAGSSNGTGVTGYNPYGGNGVYGLSATGTTGAGVWGESTAGTAIVGKSSGGSSGAGLYASNNGGGYGVVGEITPAGAGYAVYGKNASGATGAWAGYFQGSVDITSNLTVAGTCNGTTCTSDVRLKKNIQPITGSLEILSQLRPVTFEWKDPQRGTGTQIGFIAQEVEKVKPEWIHTNDEGFKTVDYTKYSLMLVDAVGTLKAENDDLKQRVKSLEAGRRPLVSGFGEGGIGLGLCAIAAAMIVARRKRPEERA